MIESETFTIDEVVDNLSRNEEPPEPKVGSF